MPDAFLRESTRTAAETVVRVELVLLALAALLASAVAAGRGGAWLVALVPLALLLAGIGRGARIIGLRGCVDSASTAGIVVASSLLLVLGILPHLGLYRPVTVLSGSMRPAFAPGDMIFVTPERLRDIRVGQVITYKIPVDDQHVESHRVIRVLKGGDDPVVITKGDANTNADPWKAELHGAVVWRERFHVPALGRLIVALRSRTFHDLTIFILPALLAAYALWRIWRAPTLPTRIDAPKAS